MPPATGPHFRRVVREALTRPGVALETRYDGSPVLRLEGCFLAAPASHPSASADSLVVRADPDARALWLEEAPDTYYVTEPIRWCWYARPGWTTRHSAMSSPRHGV